MPFIWKWIAIKPCFIAVGHFFWGETMWGLTAGLQRIRRLRLLAIVCGLWAMGMVGWAITSYHFSVTRANDNYSYYEGKVLEERVKELQNKVVSNSDDIRRIALDNNTHTLLAAKMQAQIEQMQALLDNGIKVLGAVVIAIVGSLLKDLVQIRVRRERAHLGHRRSSDESGT